MAEFDYKAAWRELAQPSFMALPSQVQELVGAVSDYPEPLRQGPNFDVPMPADLSPLFEAIDSPTLAAASRIVNSFGHWAPSGSTHLRPGAHWQFSNLADQVLRGRCEVSRGDFGNGISHEIHEGIVRVCISTPALCTCIEVCPAEATNMDVVRLRQPSRGIPADVVGRSARDRWAENQEAITRALKAELGPWNGLLAGWDNTDRFMA